MPDCAEVADEVVGPNFTLSSTAIRASIATHISRRGSRKSSAVAAPPVVIRLYGPNLDSLRAKAREVADTVKGLPGVADLQVEPQVEILQLEIEVRQDAASRFRLHAGDVRRAVTTLVKGTKVGEIFEDQKIFDVAVWAFQASGPI